MNQALALEELCALYIKQSVLAMEKILRNLSNLVSPVVDTVSDMQTKYGPVGLKKWELVTVGCGNHRCA